MRFANAKGRMSVLWLLVLLLAVFMAPASNAVGAKANFNIGVSITQMTPQEARSIIYAPTAPRLRCEGLYGTTIWTRLSPEGLSIAEWAALPAKMGAYRVISEDVVGYSEGPCDEWAFWTHVVGRRPSQGMVYRENGGLVTDTNRDGTLEQSGIPGFDPTARGFYDNSWNVWDTVLDYNYITNYGNHCSQDKIILLARRFKDEPDFGAPYRSHLLDSIGHPNVIGVTFEMGANIDQIEPNRIAKGIQAVLNRGKDCYLLLPPGTPDPHLPYAARVIAVVRELERRGVPLDNDRLWVILACYDRSRSQASFLKEHAGDNSVEQALERLRDFRRSR